VTVFQQPPQWWTLEDDRKTARLKLGDDAPGLAKV
jgi:hypothetical protein